MIGCRTADYPVRLTEVVAAACDGCTLADLAPLTRDEAVELADSVEGIDGEALVAAAVAAGAGGLASVPLTLAVLARTYRRTGSLEDDPARLFEQGVEELLDEPDVHRHRAAERTSLVELGAVAGRVAARLLLRCTAARASLAFL